MRKITLVALLIASIAFGQKRTQAERQAIIDAKKSGTVIADTSIVKKTQQKVDNSNNGLHIGLKGGLLLANVKDDNEEVKTKIKAGVYVGAFFEYVDGKIAPEIEISYNQFGSRGDDSNTSYLDYEYQINSFLISPSLKVFIVDKFAPKVGFYMSQIISVKATVYDNSTNGYTELDLTDDWNNTEFGMVLGFQFNATKKLLIEANYLYGFSDLSGDQVGKINNRSIRFGLGYKFL